MPQQVVDNIKALAQNIEQFWLSNDDTTTLQISFIWPTTHTINYNLKRQSTFNNTLHNVFSFVAHYVACSIRITDSTQNTYNVYGTNSISTMINTINTNNYNKYLDINQFGGNAGNIN